MRAVVVQPLQAGSVRLAEVPPPVLQRGQALVRVLEVGIDGTDRDISMGEYGEAPPGRPTLVMAHESVGIVERVAEDVSAVAPGDLVVATVRRPCAERCPNCAAGEFDHCVTGHYLERGIKGLDGYASECYAEDPAYLIGVPSSLRSVAVLLEPLSVAEKALREAFAIQARMVWQPGLSVVAGAGSLGLLVAMALRLRGVEVVMIDLLPEDHPKARRAVELGARYVDGRTTGLSTFRQRFGPIDLVVEATGDSRTVFEGLPILGNNGILVALGLSTTARALTIPADAINLERVLENLTVVGCVNSHRRDFEQGLVDMGRAQERFPGWLERLISRRVRLDEVAHALERRPDEIKVVLTISVGAP
ncbi:MAG TPA: glucose 1-dehydrogenase [Stenomitos sp.]